MELGENDVQPTEFRNSKRKADVGAAARHICRYGDLSWISCRGHYLGFGPVLTGVEYDMNQPSAAQSFRELF
jgi:hypothetical protein